MKLRNDLSDLPPYTPGKRKPGALKLASNENPLGPSPLALEAIQAHLNDAHLYPDGGAPALKDALAAEWNLEPGRFTVGNGSDELFSMITGAYLEPGDNAITAAHTFSLYEFAVRLYGGSMRRAAMPELKLDLGEFLKLVDARTKMVFLCNPNNPTATYFSEGELRAFLDQLPAGILVVLDEAYAHFADAPDFPNSRSLLDSYPNLLVLRTFSKLYGLAAMRVGYAVSSPDVARDLSVVRLPFNVGTLSQFGAAAALGDRDFLEKSLRLNREGREFLARELAGRGYRVLPSQANFLAFHVGTDSQKVFQLVMEEGVTIRPLTSFGLKEWIRVSVGTPEQNREFLRAWDAARLRF